VLPTMATRLHSTGQVETTFRLPVGSCRDTHGRILARKLGGRQSVYIAARSACWRQKQVSVVPQFESAALDCGCRTAPAATIWLGRNREQIPPWPFGRERCTAVPTGIGGCWPATLIPLGCSSGTNLTFRQVAKSPTLRSEPFSSRLATDRRSKNSCA